jgi:hypothetical protein
MVVWGGDVFGMLIVWLRGCWMNFRVEVLQRESPVKKPVKRKTQCPVGGIPWRLSIASRTDPRGLCISLPEYIDKIRQDPVILFTQGGLQIHQMRPGLLMISLLH